jgi:hypothetical protein
MAKIKLIPKFESFGINEAAIDGDRQMITRAIENMVSRKMKVGDVKQEIKNAIDQSNNISSTFKSNLKYSLRESLSDGVVSEASNYEFNPNETAERLKRREQQNIERYRAAQEREDAYGIEYYKYRIAMDKIDLQKLQLMTQIHQLKQKNKK